VQTPIRQRLLQQLPFPLQGAPLGSLHCPPQQTFSPVQVTHVPPPLPQRRFVFPVWQMLFEQQPEQAPGPQTQVPFEQPVPVGQVTHVAPPVPQA
jgi:hypothetical protein